MSKRQTVWILGSGFSRPLGGPTLASLFTPASHRFLKYLFAETPFVRDYEYSTRVAVNLYNAPNEFRTWSDPEDFLSKLDNAVQSGSSSQSYCLLSKIIRDDLNETRSHLPGIASGARRFLAAECCAFLIDNPTSLESWIPYKNWATRLNKNDTIITFNYDQVLERLGGLCKHLRVVLPDLSANSALVSNATPILKLHGSTSWRKDNNGYSETSDEFFALHSPAEQMVIASPGPCKTQMVQDLDMLWNIAESRLSSCQDVIFLGYRFPPSDAESRHRLLKAIRENTTGGDLRAEIVLGPPSDDSMRLKELLQRSKDSLTHPARLREVPLYVQDFLETYAG